MSWSVPARTAAMILLRVSHAKKIAPMVFKPKSGVNPKKKPMATPPAMASGVSRMASSLSECSRNQRCTFMVSFLWRPQVKSYHIPIPHACPAENIQSRADGEINSPLPQLRHLLQVRQRTRAAGVGGGNRRPLAEERDEFLVDAAAKPFHIHRVHEKFVARAGELLQSLAVDFQISEFLPAIGHHEIIFTTSAAAQIEHQPILADGFDKFGEPLFIHVAVAKHP